jgi:hypothetical protein
VVYPGQDNYSLGDGVEAVGLFAAVDELRAQSR